MHGLEHIRAAVKLVEEKADPADLSAFVQFGLDVAGRVACAYRETKAPISEAEQRALTEVAAAFGRGRDA